MSWYECPKCGRELSNEWAVQGKCRKCGDVVVKVCGKTPDKPLDLNRATALELQRIAGFGKKTAGYVLSYRSSREFTSVDELRSVRGIGGKTYEKLADKVYVATRKVADPYADQRWRWERLIPDATVEMQKFLNKTFPRLWCKLRFEHVDAAAYWFSFELVHDDRRQTWCVRHSDLEG